MADETPLATRAKAVKRVSQVRRMRSLYWLGVAKSSTRRTQRCDQLTTPGDALWFHPPKRTLKQSLLDGSNGPTTEPFGDLSNASAHPALEFESRVVFEMV